MNKKFLHFALSFCILIFNFSIFVIPVFVLLSVPEIVIAQTSAPSVTRRHAALFFAPRTATILEGSTLQVPVFINTYNKSINTVDLQITFDAQKLAIIRPAGETSIIGIWLEPPVYSNESGTVRLVGVIPNGIVTESGLLTTLTFKALSTGTASVNVSAQSRVLANDGNGTEVSTEFDHGSYTIIPKPAEGPVVSSETHPFQEQWYNNNNPILKWEKNADVTDFSFVLDDKPFTIPDNDAKTSETTTSYQHIPDGLRYFHIKARKQGVWGSATHFLMRIDTMPPAAFEPPIQMLTAAVLHNVLISFFTTDALSGVDHYEVGVFEKINEKNSSPLFVQSESPYQLSSPLFGDLRVVVRAIDKAGNVRDASADVATPWALLSFIKKNWLLILLFLIIIADYLFHHQIMAHFKRIVSAIKKEEHEFNDQEKKQDSSEHHSG